MPIKVTCQCGKSFAAKDELAGKAVKCPNCQQPLRIPGGAQAQAAAPKAAPKAGVKPAAAARPAAKAAPQQAAKAAPRPASASSSGIGIGEEIRAFGLSDSALSEVGLTQQALNTRPCPGCTAPLSPDAVICIKCGFNTKLGRRMDTIKVGGQSGHEGHGAIAADLMDRAATAIDEQKEEDRKKTGEGVPWWAYLLGLMALVGFMATMMLLEQSTAVSMAAVILMVIAWLVSLYAGIRMLVEAFSESFVCGLMYLLVPFYALYYIVTRWDRVGTYFIMQFAAGFVMGLAMGALQLAPMLKKTEGQGQIPGRPGPLVASVVRQVSRDGGWESLPLAIIQVENR